MVGKKELEAPAGGKAGIGCLIPERTKNFLLFSTHIGEIDLPTLGPLTAKTRAQKELLTVFKKTEITQYHVLQIFLACLQSPVLPARGLSLPLWHGFPVAHMQEQTDNRQKSRREYAEQRAKGSRDHSPATSLLPCDLMNKNPSPSTAASFPSASLLDQHVKVHSDHPQFPYFTDGKNETEKKKGSLYLSKSDDITYNLSQDHLFRAFPNVTNLCSDRARTR